MAKELDYYKVLEVKNKASASEIRKAYRRLARKYHPDINPGDKGAEERFKQVQEAYSVLKDPEKRRAYDRFGTAAAPGPEFEGFRGFQGFDTGGGGGFSGFGDIFSGLFGGRGRTREEPTRPTRGSDLESYVSIPFLEAISGTRTRISFGRLVSCRRCSGSGSISAKSVQTCPRCQGRGEIHQQRGTMSFVTTCPECGGSGRASRGDCPDCQGTGSQQVAENLTVRIPAGVNDGSRVRIPSKGHAGRFGGPAGDLFLVIKVQPHPVFRREGNNILCLIPVTVTEAALGGRIEVPTVGGRAWLNIPAGTQSGQRFRLKGRGVPALKNRGKGDQIVEVQVVLPTIDDERSKQLLREFASLNPQNPRRELGLR